MVQVPVRSGPATYSAEGLLHSLTIRRFCFLSPIGIIDIDRSNNIERT